MDPTDEFQGFDIAAENERSAREQPWMGQSLAGLSGLLRGFPLSHPFSNALENSGPDAMARARVSNPATYYTAMGLGSAPALALGPPGALWPAYLASSDPGIQRWYGDGKKEFENRLAGEGASLSGLLQQYTSNSAK
jgi:hypothetical protein